jgi:hypothetical protein
MTTNGAQLPPAAQEKINTDIVTLTRYLTEEQAKHPEATGDFTYARAQGASAALLEVTDPDLLGCSVMRFNSPSRALRTISGGPH